MLALWARFIGLVGIKDFENKEPSGNDAMNEQICILPMKFKNANLTEIYCGVES